MGNLLSRVTVHWNYLTFQLQNFDECWVPVYSASQVQLGWLNMGDGLTQYALVEYVRYGD